MRNPSIFIVDLSRVKNRQTLQGRNGHATFGEPSLGIFSAAVEISHVFNMAVAVHVINNTENQTAMIKHFNNNYLENR